MLFLTILILIITVYANAPSQLDRHSLDISLKIILSFTDRYNAWKFTCAANKFPDATLFTLLQTQINTQENHAQ
jgi:hypothetical protein